MTSIDLAKSMGQPSMPGIFFLLASIAMGWCAQSSGQNIQYTDYPQQAARVRVVPSTLTPGWITISGEHRERVEGQTSFAYAEGNEQVYDLDRTLGSIDVHPLRSVHVVLQGMDSHVLGLTNEVALSNMRDNFDLRQGYVQVASGSTEAPVQISAGRQALEFGSERLIGVADWTNTSRTFDGFFLRIGNRNRIDLFSSSPVTVRPTSLDKHGKGLTFHGAYGSIGAWVPQLHLSPFFLIRTKSNVLSRTRIVGNELETTVGAEAEGVLKHKFSYLVNGALQRGAYSSDSIHAHEAFAKVYYQTGQRRFKPRLGLEYDYASGDGHQIAGTVGTYDQLFPTNHNVFGLTDLIGFQNIRQARVNVDLTPARPLTLLIQVERLNLAQRRDAVYSSGGAVAIKAPAAGFASSEIGTGLDISAKYIFRESLVLNTGVGHLFPGDVLHESGKGSAQTVAYLAMTYRFRFESASLAH